MKNLLEWPKYLHESRIISLGEKGVTVLATGLDKVKSALSVSIITKWPNSIEIVRGCVRTYKKIPAKETERKVQIDVKTGT